MKKEEIFDLLFDNCKDYLKLNHWDINFNFDKTSKYDASLEKCDLTHFTATISYTNEVWEKINTDYIDDIILLTLHEMLHIFTGTGSNYFKDNEDDFNLYIWRNNTTLYYNSMIAFEEQMTNIIDKVIFEWFKQTKQYKEIKKKIKLL